MLVLFGSISSMLRADDVLPEVGKTYLIKSDNVTTGKIDQDYYLYNDNGNLRRVLSIQFILLYQTAELFNCPICEL